MSSKSILALFLCFAFLLTQAPSRASASSISKEPRILQSGTTKFGDITLLPNQFRINNFYLVTYEFTPAGNITFAIKFDAGHQFFGLGLGTQMKGADIWVFYIQNNTVIVSDRHGGPGHIIPLVDAKDNLKVLGWEVAPTFTIVKFTRALNTHDPDDHVIAPGPTDFIWSTLPGSPTPEYHGPNRGTLTVNLQQGTPSTSGGAQNEEAVVSEEEYSSMEEEAIFTSETGVAESLNVEHEVMISNEEVPILL